MSGQQQEQQWVAQAVTLFAKDTIMAALRVMQEHGVRQLPVVDEVHGNLIGEVTEEQLRRLWKVAPLSSMEEVLSGSPQGWQENLAPSPDVERPEVTEVSSLVDFYQVPNVDTGWVH
jgi:predicted transcriptional regulator